MHSHMPCVLNKCPAQLHRKAAWVMIVRLCGCCAVLCRRMCAVLLTHVRCAADACVLYC